MSYRLIDEVYQHANRAPHIEQSVLVYLAWKASSKHRSCYPAITTISNDTGLGKSTILRAVKNLKKWRVLTVGKTKKYGKWLNHYTINPVALWDKEGLSQRIVMSQSENCDVPERDINREEINRDKKDREVHKTATSSPPPETPEISETSGEDQMKGQTVEEILNLGKTKAEDYLNTTPEEYAKTKCLNGVGNFTGTGANMLWGFLMVKNGYTDVAKSISLKERKMLNTMKESHLSESDAALVQVMIACLSDWHGYTKHVKDQTGLPNPPKTPQVFYLVKWIAEAISFVQLAAKKSAAPKMEGLPDWYDD